MIRPRNLVAGLLLPVLVFIGFSVPVFAQTSPGQQEINNGLCAGASLNVNNDCASSGINGDQTGQTVNNLISEAINILSVLVGVVAGVMIIIGGLRYITSGGNDTSVTGAKNTLLYAIVGLVIVALAQVIVHFVLSKVVNP